MQTIQEVIGDLLLQHNCVIIPQFGGFVAKRTSAQIDFSSGSMLPPGKSLLFNKQLVNNDGLLYNEIAQKQKISFKEAEQVVNQELASWRVRMVNGERIDIDRVGRIYLDAEKNICFEQDRFFNLLLESYGLKQVHFLTEEDVLIVEKTMDLIEMHQVEKEDEDVAVIAPIISIKSKEQKVLEEKEESEVPEEKTKNRSWRYIAAACLLPVAFYSFWLPLKTDVLESGVITLQDFNPFYKHEEGQYKPISSDRVSKPAISKETLDTKTENISTSNSYSLKYSEDKFIEVDISGTNSKNPNPKLTEIENNVSPNQMHYIVGCFGNKNNAERLVKSLKKDGFNAKIADVSNGLYRVSAGGAISNESLEQIASQAKSKGYKGWYLR